MLISFEEQDPWLIAQPKFQRLDALVAPDFSAAMTERCQGGAHVILDLVEVNFIDSRGLAALVSVFKLLAHGGTLRLANASDQVEMLLRMTRLNQLMSTYSDVEQAIKG